jgi:hypothetical protein
VTQRAADDLVALAGVRAECSGRAAERLIKNFEAALARLRAICRVLDLDGHLLSYRTDPDIVVVVRLLPARSDPSEWSRLLSAD